MQVTRGPPGQSAQIGCICVGAAHDGLEEFMRIHQNEYLRGLCHALTLNVCVMGALKFASDQVK